MIAPHKTVMLHHLCHVRAVENACLGIGMPATVPRRTPRERNLAQTATSLAIHTMPVFPRQGHASLHRKQYPVTRPLTHRQTGHRTQNLQRYVFQ